MIKNNHIPSITVVLFLIHGLEVFSMVNYDNSWDGTSIKGTDNETKLPTGTYNNVLNLNTGRQYV